MNENINNPLNDFLNATEASNDLFADLPFKEIEATTPSAENSKKTENSKQEEQPTAPKQTNLFAEALAQTPSAPKEDDDPFSAALKKAQAQSDERLSNGFSEKDALFSYGKVKDEIKEHEVTFEDLRQKYETDFPELSESKKVSWSVSYGKVTKAIQNPGLDKVYDIKSEIEKSKQFLDGIKKAKSDADKQPECLVKPRVIAQSKGEGLPISSYKEYCLSVEEAQASKKPIVLFPTRSGKIYEMRKTPVGVFTAPAVNLPELSESNSVFKMELPKIPMHILMTIVNFFEKLSDAHELEALVHILYDTIHNKYTISVPKQELTHTSVHSVMEEDYPEHLIHVMDIHSHNTMPAKFSEIDDADEKATRLYAVVGRLDKVFPDITVRASCAGKFISVNPETVFETAFKAYQYPPVWERQIEAMRKNMPLKVSRYAKEFR